MNLWTKRFIVLFGAGILCLVGQYFRGSWWPGLTWPFSCVQVKTQFLTYCAPTHINTLGLPFIVAGEVLFVIALLLIFANELGFRRWWHFSRWFIPITALFLVYCTPIALPVNSFIYTDKVVDLLGFYIYVPITLAIIVISHTWHKESLPIGPGIQIETKD